MSEHSQALQDATARLYTVFAPFREQQLRAEDHENLPEFDNLTTTPLQDLTVADLTPLIESLAAQDNSGDMLRHFLPRILELCIEGYHRWSIGMDTVLESLNTGNWQSWSEIEKHSIETFLRTLWLHHLHEVSPAGTTSSADTILEAVARVMDIQPFLDVWLDVPHNSATAHIASLTVYGEKRLLDVRRWLMQADILRRIEAAFWDCRDSNRAAMFAKAAEYLRLDDTLMPA